MSVTVRMSRDRGALWDRLGCWASSACAVHCAIAPLLFLAVPAFAEVWAHPASHALVAIAVVPLALTVIVHGFRKHRRAWVLVAAVVGIACILTGSAMPYLAEGGIGSVSAEAADCTSCCPSVVADASGGTRVHIPPAAMVTIVGSLFLIASHAGNRRGCQSSGSAHPRNDGVAEAASIPAH